MRTAVACLAFLFCVGCGLRPEAGARPVVPEFTSAPVFQDEFWFGQYRHPNAIAMVAHATGTVSVCDAQCTAIGKIQPSRPGEIVIQDPGRDRFFVTNVMSGQITVCVVDFDDNNKPFKSGKCAELGTAPR